MTADDEEKNVSGRRYKQITMSTINMQLTTPANQVRQKKQRRQKITEKQTSSSGARDRLREAASSPKATHHTHPPPTHLPTHRPTNPFTHSPTRPSGRDKAVSTALKWGTH